MLAGPGLHDSPSLSRPSSANDGSRHMLPMPPSTIPNGHSRSNGNHLLVHGASNGLQHSSEAGSFGGIIAVHGSILKIQVFRSHSCSWHCCALSVLASTRQACAALHVQQSEIICMSLLHAFRISFLSMLRQKCFLDP